jgi:hypothetical protein
MPSSVPPDSSPDAPPRRRLVQTPRIIAVRLTIFAALLALTVRGLFARRMGWRACRTRPLRYGSTSAARR